MTNDPTMIDASACPFLVVRRGGRVIHEIALETDLSIGRAEDNDLQLADPKVSRHHAQVRKQGSTYVLTDLDSANGTFVNSAQLTGDHTLRHGERIEIGDSQLTYREPGYSSEDTMIGPPVARVVPPPYQQSAEPARGRTVLTVGLIALATILIIATAVAAALLLVPGLTGQATPTPIDTQTPQVVTATESTAASDTPEQEATATAESGTQEPGDAASAEVDELLAEAQSLTQKSMFEDAVAIYEDLVEQEPDDARPEIGWAWALIWDDDAQEAVAHAERAVEIDPGDGEAAAVLGRAYVSTGDKAQALEWGQKAVELAPGSSDAHAVLAEAQLLSGKTQDATDEADVALVQDINNANAHRVRGWIYYVADSDMGRAAGELQVAAGLQPELWLRRHELGELLLNAEDYTTAIMALQDALGIRPKAVTYTAIGEAYYRLGQYDQAKASLDMALSAGAEDLNTLVLSGATYARLGRCDDAKPYYDQVLDQDGTEPLALEAQDLCEGSRPSATPSPTTVSASRPTPVGTSQPTAQATKPPSRPAAVSGRIAFPVWDAQAGRYDTFLAQAKDGTTGWQLVVEEMHQPAFNADGSWLAVNGERDEHMNLFIVKPDGSGLKEISAHIEDSLPWWSPDGESLVFSSTQHGDKQSRVYIIDEVPFTGRREQGRTLNFGPDDVRGEYPSWTSDDRIVYKGCDSTVEPAKCGLYIMPSAPGPHPATQLTENPEDTAPAPHGDQIAFMSNREGNWEIYIMQDDGSEVKRLTTNAAHDGLPTWSPDGKTLAFVSDQGGGWAVWAMSPDGSNRRKLFDIGGGGLRFNWQNERISWAP